MQITDSYIYLENVSFYAYHGVGKQERKVGNTFYITLRLKTDFSKACLSDDVAETVSYADVHNVLAEEMTIPSNLLEHVCNRIAERLFNDFPAIAELSIKLSKKNPPMGADLDAACVEMHCKR
ncbi:dihydroneopterin aldolase [Bacteroides sp. 214]|uniref:dihydroneopterin aldolase n=1 Tax=Bacteroides sp. 214 TaxID=2302935 RepID=UPI0013CF4363|nr:dihydroneopterin aldolase [Bacteroides sp. 214]NDW11725.1 dihydroneopterin aldolase [Bacteroides sp. 214]